MDNGVNKVNIIENSTEFSVTLRSEAVKRIGRLEESLFISYYRQAIIAKAVRLTFSGRPIPLKLGLLGGLGGFLDAVGGGEWRPIVGSTLIARNHNPKLVIGSLNLAEFFVTIVESITFFIVLGMFQWEIVLGLALGGVRRCHVMLIPHAGIRGSCIARSQFRISFQMILQGLV